MRRRFTLPALLLALVFGLLGGGVLVASAQTANDAACRQLVKTGQSTQTNLLAYDACRFDKLDAQVAALQPGSTSTPAPTPSPSPTTAPKPSATPTPSATAPTSATPSPTGATCTNPTATFTGEGSQGVGNGYDISAEQWGVKSGYASTLRYCSKDLWSVTITAKDDDGQHAVQSYPSIRRIYHDWSTSDFSKDPRLSSLPRLTVDYAVTSPASCAGCIYETAFDNWLNGIGGNTPTEQMIWLRNAGQRPYGTKVGTATIGGQAWDVWTGNSNHYVAFVSANGAQLDVGTVDVKAFTQYQVDHGLIGATSLPGGATDPYVGQISLGVEPVKVDGQRWDFNRFALTDN